MPTSDGRGESRAFTPIKSLTQETVLRTSMATKTVSHASNTTAAWSLWPKRLANQSSASPLLMARLAATHMR